MHVRLFQVPFNGPVRAFHAISEHVYLPTGENQRQRPAGHKLLPSCVSTSSHAHVFGVCELPSVIRGATNNRDQALVCTWCTGHHTSRSNGTVCESGCWDRRASVQERPYSELSA